LDKIGIAASLSTGSTLLAMTQFYTQSVLRPDLLLRSAFCVLRPYFQFPAASIIALKIALGRMAFDVLSESGW
jgi:hypothetical protein